MAQVQLNDEIRFLQTRGVFKNQARNKIIFWIEWGIFAKTRMLWSTRY